MPAEKDLVSTIAAACNNMPPEPADPVIRDVEDIHNPELDQAIDELVEQYKAKLPESNTEVQFLHPPLSAEGQDAKAEQCIGKGTDGGPEVACPRCGEPSTRWARFCAMCGMPLQGTAAAIESRAQKSELPATAAERKAERPRYRNSPYLVAAIVMLVAVVSWRAGWDYGLRIGSSQQQTLPPAARAASTGKASVKQRPQAHSTTDDAVVRIRRPKLSEAASKGRTSVKQQPQADSSTDDDEVVWIRRPTGTGK